MAMPKVAKELTDLALRRLKEPGMYAAGGVAGLHFRILPSGGRTWILRVTVGGKRRDIGLGGYPTVSLAGARDAARAARESIRSGIDPVEQKRVQRTTMIAARGSAVTFDDAARQYIEAMSHAWRNAKHEAQWVSTLATYASPVIGPLAVRDIELSHVVRILEPIWSTKTETAVRLRGRIESVLDWCAVRGYRQADNPARWKGHLDKLLPKPAKVAEGIGARALEFAILTAARSGEVRGACWSEFNLQAGTWTRPGDRMKAGKEHRVPLSDQAQAVLESMPRGHDFVFPGSKDGSMLSDMSLTAVLRRMGHADITVHGFRSAFRDWAAEATNYPREVAEMALAHAIGNDVEAAYRRGDLFEKRRRMMRDWAKFCDTTAPAAVVTPIRSTAA
jgi:integrase